MNITYNETKKDLPNEKLHRLFIQAGWSDGKESTFLKERFNYPFINSTEVISAWDKDKLVGVIRSLSDKTVRSIIHDLVVDEAYQGKGIGSELIKRMINKYPNSEWIVHTTENIKPFYAKFGFIDNNTTSLRKPSKYF